MYIVKCKNSGCNNLIRLSEGKFLGGMNDSGGIIIKCNSCNAIFPCNLKNPFDASGITSGGQVLDSWVDKFPISFESKYNIKESEITSIERILVFGYEKPPKVHWQPSQKPTFGTNILNLEQLAFNALNSHLVEIKDNYKAYFNYYIKGKSSAKKSFIVIYYKHQDVDYQAIFAKEIDSENDLNPDNLYLIHHSMVNLINQVDGIFTKTECLGFLERFLNRWRYTANEVLLVVPFIGYHYATSQEALTELWNWLEINVNVDKTNLITRKGTFNLYKKAQDSTGIPYDLLVEWGLLEPLIESMEGGKMPFFQQSHAKYYVGVFENYVEVLSGSFNIHTGPSFENITFRRYSKDFFKERYLHMFNAFSFSPKLNDEYVHYMILGTENKKHDCEALSSIIQLFKNENE